MLESKDYCDYETWVALKELGYSESFPLSKDYEVLGKDYDILLYEAQKFLREEKRVEVNSCYDKDNDKWFYYVLFMDYPDLMGITASESKYDSYEEALSKGIKETINILKDGIGE